MDAYGGFLTSKYGCICWIEVEDHFVISFVILTHINMHDQNICMIVSEMSGWNKNISTKNRSYKHRDSIVSQKRYCNFHLTLSDTILIFEHHFWCILTFTIWVLSNIFFIKNCWVQTRFRERPHVSQVSSTTSWFWKILHKKYQIQKGQAYKETQNQEEKGHEITISDVILISAHYCYKFWRTHTCQGFTSIWHRFYYYGLW